MSMDLNGINNQNEYYTNHYFASVFEENAQDTLRRWREQAASSGERTPWQKINLVSKTYFAIREKSARFRGNEQVKPFVDDLLRELLPALGYPYAENSEKQIVLDEGITLPVSLEMTKATNQLSAEKGAAVWYNNAPVRVEPGQKRKFGSQVYHFLLGDPGMCNYTDKVIKSLEPEKINTLKKKVASFCRPLTADELDYVLELSATIDNLWDAHIETRKEIGEKTTDPLTVWGQPEDVVHQPMTIREKDKIYEELYQSIGAENASPYARLKAVMDYWCALWFWPIEKADEFPTRQEFLFQVQMMLGMDVVRVRGDKKNAGQLSIFDLDEMLDGFMQDMVERYDRFGAVNLDQLRKDFGQLRIANEIAQGQHFFHWELEFADVFQERGGFDLIVGNPPWIKLIWFEKKVLADTDPMFTIKQLSATQTIDKRQEALQNKNTRATYFSEYCAG